MVAVFERVTAGEPVEADSVTVYAPSGVAGGTGTRTLTVFRLPGVIWSAVPPGVASSRAGWSSRRS